MNVNDAQRRNLVADWENRQVNCVTGALCLCASAMATAAGFALTILSATTGNRDLLYGGVPLAMGGFGLLGVAWCHLLGS
jgi:hypothetical protein